MTYFQQSANVSHQRTSEDRSLNSLLVYKIVERCSVPVAHSEQLPLCVFTQSLIFFKDIFGPFSSFYLTVGIGDIDYKIYPDNFWDLSR